MCEQQQQQQHSVTLNGYNCTQLRVCLHGALREYVRETCANAAAASRYDN